jgi:sugar lactone lactonase YvrE
MRRNLVLSSILAALIFADAAVAASTRRWIVDTTAEFLKGRGDNVEVTNEGLLRPVPGWVVGPTLEEPVVMAATLSDDGSLIVATSHPARLYRITGDDAELLAEVPAEQITALLTLSDGTVLAATNAPAAVFQWRRGKLTEAGRLGEGGLWDLAVFDSQVVVAGGSPATIYRLGKRGLERWVELPDTHASCMATDGERLLVGTSEKGLILSVSPDGVLGVVADSPFTEISDLVVGDGTVWATALVGEPIVVASPSSNDDAEKNGNGGEVEAEISAGGDLDLPKVNGKTATSEVIKLTPEGGLLSIHRFTDQVASSAAWDGSGLLVGTGYKGEVWRFVDDGGARIATVDAVQVVGVIGGGEALLTQGPAGVMWRAGADRHGRFRSAAEKFRQPVRFGEFRVEPPVEGAKIRFRSGVSLAPDETWLDWTGWKPATAGHVELPPSRAVQWEVELPAGSDNTLVDRIELAVMEINLPPRVQLLAVEQPGVVYLAAPPPSGPVIDAVHPDHNGIFTVIDENAPKNGKSAKGKKYYRAGYRTVRWKAADGNKDPLRFRLEIEDKDGFVMEVRDRITGTQLGIDTHALPDGTYRFRLTASDAPLNPGAALETSRVSRWFTVDNSPPGVTLERSGATWKATATDDRSPIARAEWSRDGDKWQALAASDGLLDGLTESFEFPASDGRHKVVVRVVDSHHNRATAGAAEE